VSGAQVYSAEAAATYGPLFFQGEYFWYKVDRGNLSDCPAWNSTAVMPGKWVLTGETHTYNSAAAAYGGIVPLNPFSLTGGGWVRGDRRPYQHRSISTDQLAAQTVSPGAADGLSIRRA